MKAFAAVFIFLISLPAGRLFEIFSWNSSIVRIENILHEYDSEKPDLCCYQQLNDQYWQKKAIEEAKINPDFSPLDFILNKEFENRISYQKNQFDNHKPDLIGRNIYRYSYDDNVMC